MKRRGWVANDQVAPSRGQRTIFSELLAWFPELQDMTNGYTPYPKLAATLEAWYAKSLQNPPHYIIRNATYFRPLQIPVPTISFVQDIVFGRAREMQLDVCRRSALTVFNSQFTVAQYPELDAVPQALIPIGVDFEQFMPLEDDLAFREKWGVLPGSICFIGSDHSVKGFNLLLELIRATDFNFCLIMKDEAGLHGHPRVRTFNKVSQADLIEIANGCTVGLCTSLRETQHMAGLEMGAIGLPLLTTNVGAYYDREPGVWGEVVEEFEMLRALRRFMQTPVPKRDLVRDYWQTQGYGLEACRQAWVSAIDFVAGGADAV